MRKDFAAESWRKELACMGSGHELAEVLVNHLLKLELEAKSNNLKQDVILL